MPPSLFPRTQRAILQALLAGPQSLSALERMSGRRKPTLLRHLRALEARDLVRKETVPTKVGRESVYSLRPYTLFLHIDPGKGAVVAFETPDAVEPSLLLVEQVPQAEFRRDVRAYMNRLAATCRDWPAPPTAIVFGSVARGEDRGERPIPGKAPSAGPSRKRPLVPTTPCGPIS